MGTQIQPKIHLHITKEKSSRTSSAEVRNRVELYVPLLSLRAFVAYERVKPTYERKVARPPGTSKMATLRIREDIFEIFHYTASIIL
jgi:hypothetical protein